MVCALKSGEDCDVECLCGTRFCYGCLEAPHPPIGCELLGRWIEKTKTTSSEDIDAEANVAWLTANAKKCPRCKISIQKAPGCDWMTCGSCSHGFCWLCLGDASIHPERAGNHAAPCTNVE